MSVTVGFFAGSDFQINDLSGSGLGFYGDSAFGDSVRVVIALDNGCPGDIFWRCIGSWSLRN
jgi:hypothetical protein